MKNEKNHNERKEEIHELVENVQIEKNETLQEENLIKNEKLFNSILENTSLGYAVIDETGRFLYYNQLFLKLFGLSESSTIKNVNDQNWSEWQVFDENFEVLHVDNHPVRKAALTGNKIKNQLVGVKTPSGGELTWMLISAEPILRDNGKIEKIICTCQDITAQRLADVALRKSEQRYRQLFSSMTEMFQVIELIHDQEGKAIDLYYRDVNPAFEKLVGKTRAQLLNKRIKELFGIVENFWFELFDRVYKEDQSISSENYDAGLNKIFEIHAWKTLENYVAVIFSDVTERKKSELKLKESEEKYKELVDNARSIIVKLDTEGRFTFFNEYAQSLFGYNEDEILGQRAIDTIVPKIDAQGTEMTPFLEDLFKNPDHFQLHINENIKKNGERIWIEWRNRALFNHEGKRTGHIAIGVDITARRLAEEKLKNSEVRYRRLFESARDGILILDADSGQIVDVNPYLVEMLGYSHEKFMGKLLWDIGFSKNIEDSKASFIELQDEGYVRYDDLPLKTKNGKLINVEFVSNVYLVDGKKVIQCNIRDITDRKISEKALIESERSLRELNATKDKFFSIITHDLKSPFTSIVGFSELLTEKIRRKDYNELEEYSGIIHKASMNVMDLLKNLIEWSRLQTGRIDFNRIEIDIVKVINEVTELLDASARRKTIQISKEVPSTLTVLADKQMISTVFRNLISNAIKFTKPGGHIVIAAVQRENDVLITVSDNGIGIKPEVIEKLFSIEAGTSTRGTLNEEGTGLGLVLCKEFISKHGGDIRVESELSKGSRFLITLPSGSTNYTN